MNIYLLLCLSALCFVSVFNQASATTCSHERRRGITEYFTCPGILDRPSARFCCGTKKHRYCCDIDDFSDTVHGKSKIHKPIKLNKLPKKVISKSVGVVIGVIIVIIIGLVVVVIVSCFCCGCCLLAKRRQQRGQVLYGGTATPASTRPEEQPLGAASYPQQAQPYPQQPQPYPQQPQPYPQQPQPYPQQPYPQQQYTQEPFATAGYPVQPPAGGPGYPGYPTPYPPPYSDVPQQEQAMHQQQQPPYNPSYPPH